MNMKRLWLGIVFVFSLMFCFQISAFAAEKIDKVSLELSYGNGGEPKAGEYVGEIQAKAKGTGYRVDYVEYEVNNDIWTVGDRPVVRIGLTAEGDRYFGYTSKSHFELSGCGATFKSAKKYDDDYSMEVYVYLKRVGGTLKSTEGLEWSGTTAVWEEIYGAKSYEVRLRRDGNTVTIGKTDQNYYDFTGYFEKKGDYTFNVRGISEYDGRTGEWSEDSDSIYLDTEDLWYQTANGSWVSGERGWWYSYQNGGYPAKCWKFINGAWYYFDKDGYMQTGWVYVDSAWYYLQPNGTMATGWQFINNRWYYLEGDGTMVTGWKYINGKWYCMDDSGAMYANTRTPDGSYVDASGARVY